MNTVVFVCHLVALDLLLTGLFSSILFIPYTADPQTTHTHTSIFPLAPLTDLYCCTTGNPHNTQIHHQPPTIPESPKRAADGHPSRTASDNCSLSLQINIHQEQQNTLMWSRVQTDTQQSPLHVQHTQSTAALASFSTQTHVVVHLRCLSYLWHVQSGCFYCFNQSAAIKQPAKT